MYLKKNGVAPIELTKYSISSVDCSGIRRISEDNINENRKIDFRKAEKCCNNASNICKRNDIHYISCNWNYRRLRKYIHGSISTMIK